MPSVYFDFAAAADAENRAHQDAIQIEIDDDVERQQLMEWEYELADQLLREQMANINQMIESKYLKQSDVDGEVEVTIVKVGQLNVAREDEQPDMKWAARLAEFKKPMILNSTNIQLLAKACGSEESEDWIGKKVVIFADPNVSFGGKLVGGLRVKLPIKRSTAPAHQASNNRVAEMEDDIPF